MSSRNLAWHREAGTSTNQAGHRDAVMGRAERPQPIQRPVLCEVAQEAPHLRHLQRLAELEGRQDAGQAARQHGLAAARRAAEEEVMPTSRSDLERPPALFLAVDLAQVLLRCFNLGSRTGGAGNEGFD